MKCVGVSQKMMKGEIIAEHVFYPLEIIQNMIDIHPTHLIMSQHTIDHSNIVTMSHIG